jgi:hypothetical protein
VHGEQPRRLKSGEPGNVLRNVESRARRTSVLLTFTRGSQSASRRRENGDGAESKRRPARVARDGRPELGLGFWETRACATGAAVLIGVGENVWRAGPQSHAREASSESELPPRSDTDPRTGMTGGARLSATVAGRPRGWAALGWAAGASMWTQGKS